jgi:hypothetical protein
MTPLTSPEPAAAVNGVVTAYFSTEVVRLFFGRAVALAKFQLAWWINRAIFSIFA